MSAVPLRVAVFVMLAAAILAACARNVSAPDAPRITQEGGLVAIAAPRSGLLTASALSNGPNGTPRWRFYQPLTFASDGTLAVTFSYAACYPTSGLNGPWYLAYGTSSLANPAITTLARCALYATPVIPESEARLPMRFQTVPPTPVPTATPTVAPIPIPTESPENVYIVCVDMTLRSVEVAAIAGPANVSATTFEFPSLVNRELFTSGHYYEFYVAKYLDTNDPVPLAR